MRVYCQVGKTSQGKFALDVAVKTLGLYKEYAVCISMVSCCCEVVEVKVWSHLDNISVRIKII